MRVDALDILELPPRSKIAHLRVPVVDIERAHARTLVARLAQHDLLPFVRLALPQSPHAACHLARLVDPQHLLEPRPRVRGLVRVPPVAQLRRCGVVHLLVQ